MNPRRIVMLVLRIVLGAVWLYAAYTKLREPWMLFAMSIDAYKLLPEWAVLTVARTLPWLELAIGLLLLGGLLLRYVSVLGAAILGVFFTAMLAAHARGLGIDCGCFGSGEAISGLTLARDGSLVAASIVLTVLSWKARRGTVIAET